MTQDNGSATEPDRGSDRRPRRVPAGVLAITVGLVLVLVLVTVGLWPRLRGLVSPYEIDSRTVAAREPVTGQAPEAGSYDRLWQRSVSGLSHGRMPARSLTTVGGDHVLTTEPDRVEAYDARTGKPSWHYAQPGWSLRRAEPSAGGVVAEFVRDPRDAESARTQVGLDPASGEVLWSKRKSWLPHGEEPNASDPRAGVLAFESDYQHVLGVRASTGDVAWRLTAEDVFHAGCGRGSGTGDRTGAGPLVVVALPCTPNGEFASTTVLAAVDPDSGELAWLRQSDGSYQTAAGFTLLTPALEGEAELLDRTGRRIHTAGECDLCTLTSDGKRAVLVSNDPDPDRSDRVHVAVAEPGKRKPRTFSVRLGRPLGGVLVADGKLYYTVDGSGPGQDATPLATLAVVDLDSGTGRIGPVPVLSYRMEGWLRQASATPAAPIDVSGNRLLLSATRPSSDGEPTSVLAALSAYEYRGSPEPVEFGGVEPESWPRACDLLADPTKVLTEGKGAGDDVDYVPSAGRIHGVRIAEPHCSVRAPELGIIELHLLWVTRTSEQARALFPEPVDVDQHRIQPVGRVLVQVSAGATEQDTDRLIDLIRQRLPTDLAGDG